jgi:histidine triad (HIT) family protein
MPTIFTKILSGELPCYKIFEDELTLSFFSIEPINLGHTLVIPKIEVDRWFDLQEPYYSRVFHNAKFIAQAIQKATDAPRIGTIVQGWEVNHFHFHMVPMWSAAELSFARAKKRTPEEFKQMQEKVLSNLKPIKP